MILRHKGGFAHPNEPEGDVEKETAEKVEVSTENVRDEVCPDEIYKKKSKHLVSVETQTLECGVQHHQKVFLTIIHFAMMILRGYPLIMIQ